MNAGDYDTVGDRQIGRQCKEGNSDKTFGWKGRRRTRFLGISIGRKENQTQENCEKTPADVKLFC